jgi:hypothetical protein
MKFKTNHHDRDLVTPVHENHPLSPQRGERVRGRGGVYFHGKKTSKTKKRQVKQTEVSH